MTIRLFFLSIILTVSVPFLKAQSVYELSYWGYKQQVLGRDTTSANARKEYYIIEKYNELNRLVSSEHFHADGKPDIRIEYLFNEKGQPLEEIRYEKNGAISLRKKFTGDEQGQVHTAVWTRKNKADDSITTRETYIYDSTGRVIKKIEIETPYGSSSTWTYEYKSLPDGQEVTATLNRQHPKKKQTTVMRYNAKGHKVHEKTKGYIIMTEYEYDANGDWTRRKVTHRDGTMMPWVSEGEWRNRKLK